MDKLAECCPISRRLLGSALKAWMSLSAAARDVCRLHGWIEIQCSPAFREILPSVTAKSADLRKQKRVHLEMIPLRECLYRLATKFGLTYNGEPASWAMDMIVETLHQAARRPKKERVAGWVRPILL